MYIVDDSWHMDTVPLHSIRFDKEGVNVSEYLHMAVTLKCIQTKIV